MFRLKTSNFLDNMVRHSIRLLVVLLLGAMACQVAWSQQPGGRRAPPGSLDRTMGQTQKEPEPEPADADELPPKPSDDHDEFPITEEMQKRTVESKIGLMLNAGKFANAQEQALFDQYYTEYYLARWSKFKDWKNDWKTISNLQDCRKDLLTKLKRAKTGQGKSKEVYDHLNALVLDFMTKMATGNYIPASRVNAMLMIGELSSFESAAPLPEALKALSDAVDNAEFPDSVRVAAMVGIQRHVAAGIQDKESRKSLTNALVNLASAKVATGSAAPGREWLIAQSAETLGLLGAVGDNQVVFEALAKIVSEPKFSLATRSIAAESLGRLKYAEADKINPVEITAALGQLAIDSCAAEALKEEKEPSAEAVVPETYRRLVQRLSAVLTALKGIAPFAQEPAQKTFLDELQKIVKPLNDSLESTQSDPKDMSAPIEESKSKLEDWLKKKPA